LKFAIKGKGSDEVGQQTAVTSGKGGGFGVSVVGQYVNDSERNGAGGAQNIDKLIAEAEEIEHTAVG